MSLLRKVTECPFRRASRRSLTSLFVPRCCHITLILCDPWTLALTSCIGVSSPFFRLGRLAFSGRGPHGRLSPGTERWLSVSGVLGLGPEFKWNHRLGSRTGAGVLPVGCSPVQPRAGLCPGGCPRALRLDGATGGLSHCSAAEPVS